MTEKKTCVFDTIAKKLVDAVLGAEPPAQQEFDLVKYHDLLDFASLCKKKNPSVIYCRVACLFDHDARRYQVVQMMLDSLQKAIKTEKGFLGRIIHAKKFDEMIDAFNHDNSEAWEFDFQVEHS